MAITFKFIQRTQVKSNGLYPIYLRVTINRENKIIPLSIACEESQWNKNKEEFRKNYKDYIQKNSTLISLKNRAENIVAKALSDGKPITHNEFKALFLNINKDSNQSVKEFWEQKVDDLNKSGRTGNARFYKDSKNSFFGFLSNKKIYFADITPTLLDKYEIHLREKGNMESGIAVRMRAIRAIFNDAIKKSVISKDYYPFEKYKLSKLKGKSEKRALSFENMQKIIQIDLSNFPNLINSRNYFVFSYYSGGINFVDMMKLTWENIFEDRIQYVRSKTKGRFDIKILPPVKDIINYYKSQNRATNYVFPILLKDNLNPLQIEDRKAKTIKKFNKELKEIALLCEIDFKLTSYVARHSFATNLKQKGVSTDKISEAMGHQNLAITQTYLKELGNDVIDEAMEQLL
jgi:integrase/recombinase XerD